VYEQNVRPVRGGGPDVGDEVFVCWDPGHAVVIEAGAAARGVGGDG